ncbi:virB8 family protein [Raoultella terrigena]|uniref:virB8 family protein n=1 Tax=Raoultella terrigena TaxID=577 RepID=UPI0005F87321|nr:type IV secretion system protein [Raoultella terrigena]
MSDLTQQAISESKTFETALRDKEARLAKAGWVLSVFMGFILTGAISAIVIMLPLKSTQVDLYVMHEETGRIQKITTVNSENFSASEALNHAETASYVKRRMRYNYFSLQADYDDTQAFNSPDVNRDYRAEYDGPDAPDKIWNKAAYVADIDVISNVHSSGTNPDRIGMLRVKRTVRRIADNSEIIDYWTVRLTYRYVPQMELTTVQREVNPLGFMITSWTPVKENHNE